MLLLESLYQTLRSISGSVVYLFGTPVAWKNKVQSVFTASTTESEWVALADSLEVESSSDEVVKFFLGREAQRGPLWCDNRSAADHRTPWHGRV